MRMATCSLVFLTALLAQAVEDPHIALLMKTLASAQAEERTDALRALSATSRLYAIPQMVAALSSQDERIPKGVAWALGEHGEDVVTAIPALLSLSRSAQPAVRWGSLRALARISPERVACVARFMEALGDSDPDVAAVAMDGLDALCPSVVPCLVELAQNAKEDKALRRRALRVLGKSGAEYNDAVPILVKMLDEEDAQERKSAAEILYCIGPSAKAALAKLEEKWKGDPDPSVQEAASRAWGKINSGLSFFQINDTGTVYSKDSPDPVYARQMSEFVPIVKVFSPDEGWVVAE